VDGVPRTTPTSDLQSKKSRFHFQDPAGRRGTASCGACRPSRHVYIVERLIDNAAREMGIDRAELRRRNTVPASAMPFKTGLVYRIGGRFPDTEDWNPGRGPGAVTRE
jgi:hypothetical protein